MNINEKMVTGLSVGNVLKSGDWPEGARCAVNFSIMVHPPWIPLKMNLGPKSFLQNENMTIVGLNRILDLFKKYEVKGTFWPLGYTVEKYPELFKKIHDYGHEIGSIGYLRQDETIEETKNEIQQANTVIQKVIGEKPVGISLYNYCKDTLKLLVNYGFLYEKSYVGQELPCEINIEGEKKSVLSIPVSAEMDDYMQVSYIPSPDKTSTMWLWSPIRHLESPDSTLSIWKNEFDACYKEGLFLSTLCHPEITGKASHAFVLEKFIQYIKSHSNVWIATAKEIATWTKKRIS